MINNKETLIKNQLSSKLAVSQEEIKIITNNSCDCGIAKIGDSYQTFIVR